MPQTLRGVDPGRLERSCDSIRFGTGADGVERAEVFLSSCRFEPHRHDTYAVGITTAGVQSFGYRGARRICLPGQMHVLYPDELHDGAPATEDGFGYRILYVEPRLLTEALGGRPLPFVPEPVQQTSQAIVSVLADLDEPLDELGRIELVVGVADILVERGDGARAEQGAVDAAAVESVRAYLEAHCAEQTPAAELERVAGLDRFTIARHFRRALGTSPDRYRTLRRLARARAAIERGEPLARAAHDAGFADQSHLTRQFKRGYGMTPSRWAELTGAGRSRG